MRHSGTFLFSLQWIERHILEITGKLPQLPTSRCISTLQNLVSLIALLTHSFLLLPHKCIMDSQVHSAFVASHFIQEDISLPLIRQVIKLITTFMSFYVNTRRKIVTLPLYCGLRQLRFNPSPLLTCVFCLLCKMKVAAATVPVL